MVALSPEARDSLMQQLLRYASACLRVSMGSAMPTDLRGTVSPVDTYSLSVAVQFKLLGTQVRAMGRMGQDTLLELALVSDCE